PYKRLDATFPPKDTRYCLRQAISERISARFRREYVKYTTRPITSQMMSRSHVATGSPTIWARQTTAPAIGTKGTHGVLKGRGTSGAVLRRTTTPMLTRTKASSVPMLTSWLSTAIGFRPANSAMIVPVTAVLTSGVRNRRWTAEKTDGNTPSRLIA